MNMLKWSICVIALAAFAQTARAQVPFFNRGATAFTPQISIVSTGVELDAQATVSADRKYVTLTARPSSSALLALQSFTFQNGQNGQNGPNGGVGGNVGDPPISGPAGNKDSASSAVRTSPSDVMAYAKAQASLLHRPGMTRVSLLKE